MRPSSKYDRRVLRPNYKTDLPTTPSAVKGGEEKAPPLFFISPTFFLFDKITNFKQLYNSESLNKIVRAAGLTNKNK